MTKQLAMIGIGLLVLSGCSQDEEASKVPEGEHVWKGTTQTIDRARAVEQTLDAGAQERKQQLEQQSQ